MTDASQQKKTVRVRIPVAVDAKGRWYAYGWNTGDAHGPNNFDELLEVTDADQVGPNEALFWLTAELPVPEAVEIAATVAQG